jgi:hypothetical protein
MESEANSWGFESAGSALYTSSTENSEADGEFSGVGFARKKTKFIGKLLKERLWG